MCEGGRSSDPFPATLPTSPSLAEARQAEESEATSLAALSRGRQNRKATHSPAARPAREVRSCWYAAKLTACTTRCPFASAMPAAHS